MHAGGFVVVVITLYFAIQVGFACLQRCKYRGDLYRNLINDGDCDSAGVGRVEQSNIGSLVAGLSMAAGFQPSNRGLRQYHDRRIGGVDTVLVVSGSAFNAAAAY